MSVRSYLSDLQCSSCAAVAGADELVGVCPACGKVLFARYDLEALRAAMPVPDFGGRSDTLWRYRELLPIAAMRFADTLGEGRTPLLALGPRARAARRSRRLSPGLRFRHGWLALGITNHKPAEKAERTIRLGKAVQPFAIWRGRSATTRLGWAL